MKRHWAVRNVLLSIVVGIAVVTGVFLYTDVSLQQNMSNIQSENADSLTIHGYWVIKVFDENGSLVDERQVNNVVTDIGMQVILAKAAAATFIPKSTTDPGVLSRLVLGDCGADATCDPPSVLDLSLERVVVNSFSRSFVFSVDPTTNSVTMIFKRVNTPSEETYREAGLVTSRFSDVLVNRVTFPDVVKPASSTVEFSVTLDLDV